MELIEALLILRQPCLHSFWILLLPLPHLEDVLGVLGLLIAVVLVADGALLVHHRGIGFLLLRLKSGISDKLVEHRVHVPPILNIH